MKNQEQAFFKWWDKIEPYLDQINLRMAFDAGYEAAKEQIAHGDVIPSHIIKIENKINKDMAEALPSVIRQAIKEAREEIAKNIEDRICDVVHNETSPQTCIDINNGLRIAALVARGQK